jgi:hypothetical protein
LQTPILLIMRFFRQLNEEEWFFFFFCFVWCISFYFYFCPFVFIFDICFSYFETLAEDI